MIDLNILISEYQIFNKSRINHRFYKKNLYKFYRDNIDEIEELLVTYYDNIDDKEKTKEFINEYPNLKTYLSLMYLKQHYLELMTKFQISSELKNFGKSVIIFENNNYVLIDLDNNKEEILFGIDDKIKTYVEKNLMIQNVFAGNVKREEVTFLKVVNEEIEKDEILKARDNKAKCKLLAKELLRAQTFDNSYFVNENADSSKDLPLDITAQLIELVTLAKDNKITKDEYYTRMYYYQMIANQNPEEIYKEAPKELKKYVIDAYIRLSSFKEKIHERTTSEFINNLVLKRIKKSK